MRQKRLNYEGSVVVVFWGEFFRANRFKKSFVRRLDKMCKTERPF